MNRVYIAGKWEERDIVNAYATMLENSGYIITCPWFRLHFDFTPIEEAAVADLEGVRSADICLFIFERDLHYSGAMSELGAALALRRKVVVIGTGGDRNIFVHHPDVKRLSDFGDFLDPA